MTAETPAAGGPQQPAPAAGEPDQPGNGADAPGAEEQAADEPDKPQQAWAARRELADHSPRTMRFGSGARVGGGLIGGDNRGVSAGRVAGDVVMDGKTEIYYQFGSPAAHSSGEIPRERLDRLSQLFVSEGTGFEALVERLRKERVLVLSGPRHSGRGTAALMLLRALDVASVHALDRDVSPTALAGQLDGGGEHAGARGYILRDPLVRRDRPLRDTDLLAARDRLAEGDGLVITVGPDAALEGIRGHAWRPPAAALVLESSLRDLVGAERTEQLLTRPEVTEFLDRGHQLREAAQYAIALAEYARDRTGEAEIARFSLTALEGQVQEWFAAAESSVHLRDKAFLVALAAFDGGPYALTAELSDVLYAFLQRTEDPARLPTVPVFGTHIGKRLELSRAKLYEEQEQTEWGPVTQLKAAYRDDRSAPVLLREVWTGHPSARPALVRWLQQLAGDGRPLVRTRAAATAAVLAYTDLPSAMALVIEPWATSKRYRHRLVAVSALTLAHLLQTPNVPRIIDDWCGGEDAELCWVAIRAHGLIGTERPVETLAALRKTVRNQHADNREADGREPDETLLDEAAASVELLLLSSVGDQVLAELLRTLDDGPPVRALALSGFVSACRRTERDEPCPLVLGWYARAAAEHTPAAQGIAALWRAALADLGHTQDALDVLRQWVLIADHDTATEWALAALLPMLVTSVPEHQRLDHLLRTMPGEDGAQPPPVAGRLRTVLPTPPQHR
ncbi:hypothetical protein [Streptomyces sp. XD-27]|uniref:hypothetical protein n=1 Tax=Streptomyces sp. XD-27 TaxID=3062779 RepID=UPI0026F43E98|nr:hypothetical protein [Streptomyces sp. XD-27]WKX71991.1 hypothetical protein Q3Y56_20680 [Streptomyces sp. XD-27]